jgi:hypothetical protein
MLIARRTFTVLAIVGAMMVSAAAASAQEIRYFVVQSTGLFEVTNNATGGRFTIRPTNEYIHVSGRGLLQVRGQTDRAERLEVVATQIRGSGLSHTSVTFHPQGGQLRTIFSGPLPLPAVVPQTVSPSTNVDNVTVTVSQNGRTVSRRLPIGNRP